MENLLIPNPSTHDVVSFNILVNDTEINPSYQVISISIIKEVNRITLAKIILRDGDAALQNFEVSNTDDFLPGKKIKIKLGFDGTNAQQFKGIITKHSIKIKENGAAELQIDCSDEAVRMTIGRHSHYFENVKDSQVFDELIGKYSGLQSDPESTLITHKELVQHSMSDWDFMLLRAEANGMLVHTNDGSIKIKKPDTDSSPVLQVTYGSSIIEFEAEMDARYQWKNVEATSWDYSNQNLFRSETSEANSFTQHGNVSSSQLANTINLNKYSLQHSGHLQEQELKTWVDAVMMRSRLAKIRGRARVTGFGGIKTGDMLKLAGVGNRFNGNAYVTAITQSIADGTWYTHIQFGLDPQRFSHLHPDADDLLSGGLLSSIHGLQVGKVVQLQSDPDGEDRILIKIPVIDNNAEGIWVRVASLDAGHNRGTFFMPEIDDEVIVGFINDDPRHAVMLGMLHSSAKPVPISITDTNHEKGIFTRSNMRIHFNDATKTITIDTPAGNSIKLDEQGTMIEIKDQNNNKITMGSAGIKMESPMEVEIKAGTNLTLSAGVSLSIGAVSLSVKADGSLALEGAMANLKASGITEITGSMVKIN